MNKMHQNYVPMHRFRFQLNKGIYLSTLQIDVAVRYTIISLTASMEALRISRLVSMVKR